KVRDAVMPLNGRTSCAVEHNGYVFTHGWAVTFLEEMQPRVATFLCVCDAPDVAAVPRRLACVADLATALGGADGIVRADGLPSFHRKHFLHVGAGVIVIVAEEMRWVLCLHFAEFDDLLLLSSASTGFLLFHQTVESGLVHRKSALASHQFGQIQRKA